MIPGLAVALLFSVGLTGAGYFAGWQTREWIAGLAADGAVANGEVVDKRVNLEKTQWQLEVEFKTDKGVNRDELPLVPNSIYDQYKIHSPIKVTYWRSRPEWYFLPGRIPTHGDIPIADGMFEFGGIAGLLCVAGLLGLILMGRDEGPPSERKYEKTAPPVDAPAPAAPSRSPGQFGTRRPT